MLDYTINDIDELLKSENYIADKPLIYAIYSALKLEKPLLLDGKPGTGKTYFAKILSNITGFELIRLQCYEGIDASKVLYEIDYAKQLSYQNILKGQLSEELKGLSLKDAIDKVNKEKFFNTEHFLIKRPVLEALNPTNNKRKILLIDEIDKTDAEVEAMLLETLSDYSISIPEYGTIYAHEDLKPIIIATSNASRELSEPFRRRCVYAYLNYPSVDTETKIISLQANVSIDFAKNIADLLQNIRTLDLKQIPSVAESVEWTKLLFHCLSINTINNSNWEEIKNTLSTLSKKEKDREKIEEFLKRRLA